MTPAKDIDYGDIQVIRGRLVISLHTKEDNTTYFWNAQQGEVQIVGINRGDFRGLRISGDGSRVFYVDEWNIQSWSIETQRLMTKGSNDSSCFLDPLRMNNSKILV